MLSCRPVLLGCDPDITVGALEKIQRAVSRNAAISEQNLALNSTQQAFIVSNLN